MGPYRISSINDYESYNVLYGESSPVGLLPPVPDDEGIDDDDHHGDGDNDGEYVIASPFYIVVRNVAVH